MDVSSTRSALSPAKQALRERYLRGDAPPKPQVQAIPHLGLTEAPLSFAQQRTWFLCQLDPDSPFYHMAYRVRLYGALDVPALERCLDEIMRRHEILRTIYKVSGDKPIQTVMPSAHLPLPAVDIITHLSPDERDDELVRLSTKEARLPFDLAEGLPIRVKLVPLDRQDHALLLTVHHIAFDGWSIGVLIREVASLYASFVQGKNHPLPALPIQYADFAFWQRQESQGERLQRYVDYWKRKLDGLPALQFPTDRPRPAKQSFRGANFSFALPSDLSQALRTLSVKEGITVFSLCLAAFQVLLHRYTGQSDVVMGTVVANRDLPEVSNIIGCLLNTLVIRSRVDAKASFRVLLSQVHRDFLDAYEHRDLPFEKLVEELHPERDLRRNPLFQVAMVFHNAPIGALRLPGLSVTAGEVDLGITRFDLTLHFTETAEGLSGWFEYSLDLFNADTIERMAGHLRTLTEGFTAHPDARLSELPMLTEAERRQLAMWNSTDEEIALDNRLHGLFEAQARKAPDAVAVVYEEQRLSYRELNQRADRLAQELGRLGVGPEVGVGLCLDPSVEMVVGLLGVLKAGGCYVPIDPAYPYERIAGLLSDCDAPLLLAQEHLLPRLSGGMARILCLDETGGLPSEEQDSAFESLDSPKPRVYSFSPDSAAYLIYTSGSTGRPKGVVVCHRNAVHSTAARFGYYAVPVTSFLLLSSYGFDSSVAGIFWTLSQGGRLCIPSEANRRDPSALARLIAQEEISDLLCLPSLYDLLLERAETSQLASLKTVIVAGDACPPQIAAKHYARLPVVSLYNEYGPTEATVWCSVHPIHAEDGEIGHSIPIGRPIGNTQIHLLDVHVNQVPVGVPGELYIGSAGIARGYHGRPDLTAEQFAPDPFAREAGGRLYKTGDLARYRPDGTIEFLGRIDHQVKIRGYRIELGEVEAVLGRHPKVQEAVVVAREDSPGDKRLVAYVVGKEPAPTVEDLRAQLKGVLPEYMVPSAFVFLKSLPLTPNGKVDRKALPAPNVEAQLAHQYVAPRNPTEEILANIWAEVLGVERVGVYDNFFELGGHSLLAVTLIERMRRQGLPVDVRTLFTTPTVAGLVAAVGGAHVVEVPPNCIPPQCEAISPEMLPLVALSQAEIDRILGQVPGGAANVQDIYPLAPLQEGILFHHLMAAEGDAYLLSSLLAFDTRVRLEVFLGALQSVINRHDILRTAVLWEGLPEPVQVVWCNAPLAVEEVTLDPDTEAAAERLRARFDPRRFQLDVRAAPLLRGFIARDVAQGRWLLLLLIHHLTLDHTTLEILVDEVLAHLRGEAHLLPAPQPFRNFVAQARLGVSPEEHEAFFQKMLSDVTEATVPFGLLDVRGDGAGIEEAALALEVDLARRLRIRARALGVSVASLCHLAFAQVLARVSGREDVVFGTVLFGRMQGGAGADRVLGMFINTLPVRIRVGEEGVRDSVCQIHARLAELLRHEHAPLALAQRCSAVLAPTPLFSALFNYRYSSEGAEAGPAEATQVWEGVEILMSEERTNYPVTLSVDDLGEDFQLTAQVQSPIEPGRLCGYMQTALMHLVAALEMAPDTAVRSIEVLPEAERHQLLVDCNATEAEYPKDRFIHELFEAQVELTPGALAVVYEDRELTYAGLNANANQLAHHLRSLEVGPEVLVGICVERSLEMVIGLLGILKAGGTYVPIDPRYPQERKAYLLADSAPQVVLTQARWMEGLPPGDTECICLDRDWETIAQYPTSAPANEVTPGNLAYVIYTSGSTGKPKGVAVTHGNAVHSTWARFDYYQEPVGCFLLLSSFAFDSSVAGIFWTLSQGGCLCLPEEDQQRDVGALVKEVVEKGVTHLLCLPSYYQLLVEQGGRKLGSLRVVIVAGEACLPDLVSRHYETLPQVALFNEYGPTEGTVWSTVYRCKGEWGERVPIGHPIANTCVYVLDRRLQPVPTGVIGELYVGGVGLARGYLKRPDLTAERFIPNPFGEAGSRLYRTGDLARYKSDGTVEYSGRIDHQLKIRGYRIERGEVEAALGRHPKVKEAVVVAREDIPGDKRLVGYVVGEEPIPMGEELRAHLKGVLPEYMVPSAFVFLESLPLTPNGKVDRKALPIPDVEAQLAHQYVAPRDPTEEALARIWAKILGMEPVGIYDNFFELGGDSIQAIQTTNLARQTGIAITPRQLFDHRTIDALARIAGNGSNALEEQGTISEEVPLTPIQCWFFSRNLPNPHHWNQSLLLEVTMPLDPALLKQVLKYLVAHHDALRLRFTQSDGRWSQHHSDGDNHLIFHQTDLSGSPTLELPQTIEARAAQWQRRLNITHGPVMRAVLFNLGRDRGTRLLLIIHHLIVDGVSWRVLVEDLQTAYQQAVRKETIELPAKTASFKKWSERLREYAGTEAVRRDAEYWLGLPWDRVEPLPVDDPSGLNLEKVGETLSASLNSEDTRQLLRAVPKAFGTEINAILLTALAQTLTAWSGSETVLFEIEGHGREDLFEDVDLSRTVGWFTSSFPILFDLSGKDTLGATLTSVTEQLRRVPQKGLPYGVARYLGCSHDFPGHPKAQVSFNYLGQVDQTMAESSLFSLAREAVESVYDENGPRAAELEVSAQILDGKLEIAWTYGRSRYFRSTIDKLADAFVHALTKLIRHCSSAEPLQSEAPRQETRQAIPSREEMLPDWETDILLDPAIIPDSRSKVMRVNRNACFLTGTTGFVGVFLLDELLRNTRAKIYCLVRASTSAEAIANIRAQWTKYGLTQPLATERIVPVCGDLALPLLGLSPSNFEALADRIDTIYHVGAATNLLQPYSALKQTNVFGTTEILRLACTGRVKPVHYTSTLSVFSPHTDYGRVEITEDDIPTPNSGLTMGYAQTKLVAEHLVRSAAARGCPVVIYRLGTVTGHSRSGAWNTDDFHCRLLRTCIELGQAPDPDDLIDMTPVDYVSESIVYLSGKTDSFGRTFHLTNPNPIYIDHFIKLLRDLGYPINQVSYDRWVKELTDKIGRSPNHTMYPFIPYFQENQAASPIDASNPVPRVSCRYTVADLSRVGLFCPSTSARLLGTYLSYLTSLASQNTSITNAAAGPL